MLSSGHDTAITNTMSQLQLPALGLFKAVSVGGGAYGAPLLPDELLDTDGYSRKDSHCV